MWCWDALLHIQEVEDEVVDEVEAIADDDERELVGELGLLEEVLDALGIVAVALTADTLHLLDLSSLAGSLDTQDNNVMIKVFYIHFI